MKKYFAVFLVYMMISISLFAQNDKLVLVHPTKYNLELFTNLLNKDIVDIGELTIVGVYHEKEEYDYTDSYDFLEENNIQNIKLIQVKEPINPDVLYQENSCTQGYYDIFKQSKGIIFFGGPDLPPAIYGEQMSLLTRMTDPYRHYFEASFLFHLLGGSQNSDYVPLMEEKPSYTVYAICLGMQTMNIATGGTMVQDIPSELYGLAFAEELLKMNNNDQHRNYNNNLVNDSTLFSGNFHEIRMIDSKPLVGDYKGNPTPLVYSNHHQAIEKIGKNLNAIATSMDGKIIEAISHQKYPNVLGIQFHPEGKYLHDLEIKYRKNPKDQLQSGKTRLLENESYEYHLELWEIFSKKIANSE